MDLDRGWPFHGQRFDLVLDLALLCHLRNYKQHLIDICLSTNHFVLETAVCDSDNPDKCIIKDENKGIYDNSINGVSCYPTAAGIERVLTDCGMTFTRIDNARLNAPPFVYDWQPQNNEETSAGKRRLWFVARSANPSQAMHISPPAHFLKGGNNSLVMPNNYQQIIAQQSSPSPIETFSIPIAQNPHSPTITNSIVTNIGDKKFVVVIPSYKNSQWCVKNINSALSQNYDKYRIIFTDDCSPDDTFAQVTSAVNGSSKSKITTLIKNTNRVGALENLYNMIHSCQDDEIILTLDGDDWFPHENVLSKLNEVYSQNIWMTYGQYQNSHDGHHGVAQPYPKHVIDANSFRHHVWGASHLRTFYTWLFKKIRKEDLMQNGKFFPMTWDFAIMLPMLEMAGDHSKFLNDILYVYNMDNPINDHKVDVKLQHSLDAYIRGMSKYNRTSPPSPPLPPKINIGLLLIATGKYDKFIQGIVSSADKHFFNDTYNITYYIFTDSSTNAQSDRNIVNIPIEHQAFPFASMNRFKYFSNNADKFVKEDYLYYVDVDCLFVDYVGPEILGNLVGVRHCGYINKMGPYETNANSTAYVAQGKGKYYFGGGFSGGKKDSYLELSRWCRDMLDMDVSKGIIPVWHDESILNKYFSEHEPDIMLTPSYHHPASNLEYYHNIWNHQPYKAKILLLDKDHHEIRK